MPLYHREIYLPPEITGLFKNGVHFDELTLTAHAKEAAHNDRYGKIEIPSTFCVRSKDIIEAEIDNRKLVKVVVRQSYNNKFDLISVIGIHNKKAFLKTVWLNCKNDKHRTLDKSKYSIRHYVS